MEGLHNHPESGRFRGGPVQKFVESVAAGTLAGLLAGFVTGVGARMAMRISGLAAGIEKAGASTEAGFTVGEVTVAGTMALSVFSAFFGIYGGLAYRALRSWLPESRVRRGLVLGTVFLATFGPLLIESVNPDFHLFGPPLVNLCTFSSLFFLFGAIVVPLTDRLDRAVRKQTRVAAVRRAALCLLGVLAVVAMFRLSLKVDRKSTRLNSSHIQKSRMPSSA